MSRVRPNESNPLPPPLQRIRVGKRQVNQWRIIYKQDGEWTIWKSFNIQVIRDYVFIKDAKNHPELVMAKQQYTRKLFEATQ